VSPMAAAAAANAATLATPATTTALATASAPVGSTWIAAVRAIRAAVCQSKAAPHQWRMRLLRLADADLLLLHAATMRRPSAQPAYLLVRELLPAIPHLKEVQAVAAIRCFDGHSEKDRRKARHRQHAALARRAAANAHPAAMPEPPRLFLGRTWLFPPPMPKPKEFAS
jgi:hypothetical protein